MPLHSRYVKSWADAGARVIQVVQSRCNHNRVEEVWRPVCPSTENGLGAVLARFYITPRHV